MSADNGIYIATFPLPGGGEEYRVSHAQNIGDCDSCDCGEPDCAFTPEVVDHNRAYTFHDARAKVFTDFDQAVQYAHGMAREMYEHGAPLEYGVCAFAYERPILKKPTKEILQWMEDHWTKMTKGKK